MMDINQQRKVLQLLSKGLPICNDPYKALSKQLEISEHELIEFIKDLDSSNVISRFGMVISPEAVGYEKNAIVVWDVPDDEVDQLGALLGLQEKISLCYKRQRQLPDWPYNLFTVIHGKDQNDVVAELNRIVSENKIENYAWDVLISTKTFKHQDSRQAF